MNRRTILIGIAGGLLLSLALEYPLHTYLPSTLVTGWPEASLGLAVFLVIVALFLVVGIGALGALVGDAGGRLGAGMSGLVAGATAALIAEVVVGGPAAGIWGSRAVLANGLTPVGDFNQFHRLILDSTAQTMWWTFTSVWLALLTGAVLGAVGGVLAGRGRMSGRVPPRLWPPVIFVGMICSAAASIFTVMTFSTLGPVLLDTAETIGYALGYPDMVILYCASVSSWIFLLFWQTAGFLAIRNAPADSIADHSLLGIIAWLFGWLPITTALMSLLLTGEAFLASPLLLVILPSLFLGLLTMIQGWRLRIQQQPSGVIPQPGVRHHLAIALLGAGAAVFAVSLGILPFAVNVSTLIIPLISVLEPNASSGAIQSADAAVSSILDLVNANYSLQRTLSLIILPAALALGILAAVGFWLLRRKMQGVEAPSRRTRIIRGGVCLLILTAILFLITVAGFILPMYAQSVLPGI